MDIHLRVCRTVSLLLVLSQCARSFSTQSLKPSFFESLVPLEAFSVPVSELEKDLTESERSVTSVVRKCGSSVAFVTSVWPNQNSRGRRSVSAQRNNNLPPGQSLGAGSGFVCSPGYLCTNYHVVERAYEIQQAADTLNGTIEALVSNVTKLLPWEGVNKSLSYLLKSGNTWDLPQVFARVDSATQYQQCRVIGVEPDIDLAVLKIEWTNGTSTSSGDIAPVSFGSSSELIVGQTVVALGSPFGLENTVTTGVVSAVNRDFQNGNARTPSNKPIRNCIQTDAAINPGNSGGPLLNLKGEVVGINTAIITTSGSNAGIGFAVPSDQVRPAVDRILRKDRAGAGKRPNQGWLGVSIVDQGKTDSVLSQKNWVATVDIQSPAIEAGITPLRILDSGVIRLGDAIVAVGFNEVNGRDGLRKELEGRVQGEQIALTLEDSDGKRRVVYVVLTARPD